jgi:L-cysteine S-thiosulfotransferase
MKAGQASGLKVRGWGLAGMLWAAALAAAQPVGDTRRSGAQYMSPALQAMQADDAQNPAGLWVQEGRALWSRRPAGTGRSCADCHGDDPAQQLKDVATRYPAWDDHLARPLTLPQRIAQCRQRHQAQAPWDADHEASLALQALLVRPARGLPISPPADPRLAPQRALGAALFQQRLGQLDLACAHCHEQRAGLSLGGATLPQAHPTGYPSYRLQWQGLGSLQRRLRNCLTGVRAEPFAADAPEWVQLELFLMQRAAGMPLDAPAVRP